MAPRAVSSDNGFQLRRPSASGLEALANGLLPTAAFARAGGSGALAATGAACTLPLEEGALLLARPAAGAGGAGPPAVPKLSLPKPVRKTKVCLPSTPSAASWWARATSGRAHEKRRRTIAWRMRAGWQRKVKVGVSPTAHASSFAEVASSRCSGRLFASSGAPPRIRTLYISPLSHPSPIPGVSITVGGTLSLCGVFPRPAIHCGPSIAQIR